MSRYHPSAPNFAFAVAAVAMTALTLALSVGVPARMEFQPLSAAATAATSGAEAPFQVVAVGRSTQSLGKGRQAS